MSDGIPEGWARTKLNEVLESGGLFDGPFGSSLKTSDYTDSGVRVIRLENLTNLRFITDKETYISEAKYQSLLKHTVNSGDILVGSFVDGAVRVCLLPDLPTKAIAKADCFTVRTRRDIADRRYVAFQLGTVGVRDAFVGDIHGATRPRITTKQLRECELSLAPLPEQHRIVEKVEALLEQVNRAKERLDRVPLILKRFRHAVLAAACSGELTRVWREEQSGRDNARPRKELLKDQRRQLWESRKPGLSTRKYSEPFDAEPPFELPDGWEWVTVSSLALLDIGFAFKSTDFAKDGVRLLRGENVEPGALRWIDTRFLPKSKIDPARHHSVAAGEIILALDRPIVAAGLKIARVGESDLPALLVQRVMRFKMADKADTDFLFYCLRDKRFIDFVAHEGMTGSDLPHITGTGVAEFPVPLPPPDEQFELVRKIESMFKLADAIESRVQAAAARANKLPQSILSKAFSGELVPTEAELARLEGRTYETAEELLKRVTALGSKAPPTQGKGRGRRTRRAE